jgi:hypothetical protein
MTLYVQCGINNLLQSWLPPWCERPACSWSSPRFQTDQVYSQHHLSAQSNPAHLDAKGRVSEILKIYAANTKDKIYQNVRE